VILAVAACHYCGNSDDLTLDHVEPLHAGGANRPSNIVCACRPCNISKYRGDRPWRWAWGHDRCVDCGTTGRPHICHGRCSRCYHRQRKIAAVLR
jgi:hypothetical protein